MKRIILIACICMGVLSCEQKTDSNQGAVPCVQQGMAKISGKITNYHPEEGKGSPVVTFSGSNPVTAEPTTAEASLNKDGSFSLEVPVETNFSLGSLFVDKFSSFVNLVLGKETTLEISYGKDGNPALKTNNSHYLNSEDAINLHDYELMERFFHANLGRCYDLAPEEFSDYAMKKMEENMNTLIADSMKLSPKARQYMFNEYKLFFLKGCLLSYGEFVSLNYRRCKSKEDPDTFTPKVPDISYYKFLKSFDLNNPNYLYNVFYPVLLKDILSNDAFNIPPINDTPIPEWLAAVKKTMAPLTGFDAGLFYDMLAANAYSIQITDWVRPLSEKQKTNIGNYFKNKEIAKILLAKDAGKIRQNEGITPAAIHETPAVEKEKLMDAIVSRYKGKTVVVDFWATWCEPCRNAMIKSREMKSKMKDKNVVFVYITATSSPQKIWQEQIKAIGGEQYYVTSEEWKYLFDSLHFSGIPTYLIYDANGKLKNKMTAYPGNIEMQQMIENASSDI